MLFNISSNFELYNSILNSVILIIFHYYLGKAISISFFSDQFEISKWRYHYILLGIIVTTILLNFLVLINQVSILNFKSNILFIIGFILVFLIFFVKKRLLYTKVYFPKELSTYSIIILSITILYFLLSLAPITNADSLDYHIGVPKQIYQLGKFIWMPEWYNQGLAGIGENIILIGIIFKAEQFPTLIQFFALVSIVGNFSTFEIQMIKIKKIQTTNIFILLVLTIPVLLFLTTSPKPQLTGIASTALSFSILNYLKTANMQISKKVFFGISIFLFYAVATKLNFILSASFLFLYLLHLMYQDKKSVICLLGYISILIISFLLVFIPIVVYKHQIFTNHIFSYLYPIPDYYPGYKNFLLFLKQYRDSNISFPLSLLYPGSFSSFSMILGPNLLLVFLFFIFGKTINNKLFIVIISLSLLAFFLGQAASRFYFEYYIFALIFLNFNLIKINNIFFDNIKYYLIVNSIVIITILIYSVSTLSIGALNVNFREKVLLSKANGYDLSKWVNTQIPSNKNILLEHRSLSFFSNNTFSTDWINYINNNINDSIVTNSLIKRKIDYVVIVNDSPTKSNLYRFCKGLKSGPFIGKKSTRNPFNSGVPFKAWIYYSNLN
jgi:hypothetical protein